MFEDTNGRLVLNAVKGGQQLANIMSFDHLWNRNRSNMVEIVCTNKYRISTYSDTVQRRKSYVVFMSKKML